MNWGLKIVFAFGFFVVFIVYLAVRSFQQNIDLVAEDYYFQEIHYQDQIEKIKNADAQGQQLKFSQKNARLVVQFPSESPDSIQGTISLFRPSDARFDQLLAILLNAQNQQTISTADLAKGYYKVKVDWQQGGQSYFKEEAIFIR